MTENKNQTNEKQESQEINKDYERRKRQRNHTTGQSNEDGVLKTRQEWKTGEKAVI